MTFAKYSNCMSKDFSLPRSHLHTISPHIPEASISSYPSTRCRRRPALIIVAFSRHAGLLEIRTIPAKKDIAFVEFSDEGSATIAKDALHNFKIDGETKMKVGPVRI